jgi:hypothetical protein
MAPLHSESCQSKRITSRRNKQRLLQQNRHEGKLSLPSSVAHTRAREISFCDFGCARRPRSRRRGSCAQRHTLSPRSGWWATSTAVAAGRCRGFRFEFCGCGSGMELTRSGRSGMRAPGWRELRGRLRRSPLCRECGHCFQCWFLSHCISQVTGSICSSHRFEALMIFHDGIPRLTRRTS